MDPPSVVLLYIILSVFYIYNYMYCAGGVYLSSPAGVYKYHTLEVDRLSQYFHFISYKFKYLSLCDRSNK